MTIGLRWNLFLVTRRNLNLLMMIPLKPLLRESTERRFLRKPNKSNVISNELFSKLAPTGSRPGAGCIKGV